MDDDVKPLDWGQAPHFPPVAAELLEADPPLAIVLAFRGEVEVWHRAVGAWLMSDQSSEYISARLGLVLLWTLGALESPPESLSPYRLATFPKPPPRSSAPAEATEALKHWAAEVLVWRARVQDYLADVWDMIGPDVLDPRDCANAEKLFDPHLPGTFCSECLQPMKKGDAATAQEHYEKCVVRLRRYAQDKLAGAPWAVNNIWEKKD